MVYYNARAHRLLCSHNRAIIDDGRLLCAAASLSEEAEEAEEAEAEDAEAP